MKKSRGAQPARQGACLFPLSGINEGSDGDSVLFLQGMLVEAGCMQPEDVTPGVYDAKMTAAVRRYQREKLGWRNRAALDGQFGRGTLAKHAGRRGTSLLNVLIPPGSSVHTRVYHEGVDQGIWPPQDFSPTPHRPVEAAAPAEEDERDDGSAPGRAWGERS
jgi:hypothetical protein